MGACNSLGACKRLRFRFEGKDFVKKEICKQVPVGISVKDLFTHFYSNTKKTPKEFIFALKVKNKVFSAQSQVSVAELGLAPREKLVVFLIPKEKAQVSVQIDIVCCDVKQEIVQVGRTLSLESVKKLVLNTQNCCKRQIKYLALNQFVLSDNMNVNLKENDKILAVFEDSSESNVRNKWKFVRSGVNRKGICFNQDCAAFKQEVFIFKGFGEFNAETEQGDSNCCPICDCEVKVKPIVLLFNCNLITCESESPLKIGLNLFELHTNNKFEVSLCT